MVDQMNRRPVSRVDSSVHLIYHGPNDLGSLILIRIIPKDQDRTLGFLRQSCILDFTPWIRNSRYWILDSLSVEWIPDSNHKGDSAFLDLYSGFQNPGFRIPQEKFPGFHKKNFPNSGIRIPLQGANQRFLWLLMLLRDFKIQ